MDLPPRLLCASRGIGDGAWLPTLHAVSPIFVRAVLARIVLVLALAKLQPNPMTPLSGALSPLQDPVANPGVFELKQLLA